MMTQDSPPPATVETAVDPIRNVAPPPEPKQRGGAGMALLGGAVAALVGFATAQFVPNGWPLANLTATETQVSALTKELAELKAQLDQMSAPQTALSDRVFKLENAPAPSQDLPSQDLPSQDLTGVEARLSALDAQIAGLAAAGNGVGAAALTALQAEVAALKASGGPLPGALAEMTRTLDAKIAAAEAETATIVARVEAAAAAADQRSALGQIRAALDSGAPFAAALVPLATVTLPDILIATAETGVPTLQTLQAGFPDAARAVLEAATQADPGASWTQRIGAFLMTQTGARSLTPRDGSDPDAVLSRAEAALRSGDLTATISELNGLPDTGLAAMAPWLALAHQRLAAQDAVAALSAPLEQ